MKLEAIIALRILEAREAAGLTQQTLGVLVGIEEETAKVRIHQYEQGKHNPPMSMLEKIATVLDKPTTWFMCPEDMREVLLSLHKLPVDQRIQALQQIEQWLKKN